MSAIGAPMYFAARVIYVPLYVAGIVEGCRGSKNNSAAGIGLLVQVTFSSFSSPAINDAGDIVFDKAEEANLAQTVERGEREARKRAAARSWASNKDQVAPLPSREKVDARVAWKGSISEQPRRDVLGFFVRRMAFLDAIAQTGDPAPGGGTFDFPAYASSWFAPSMNAMGEVAFGGPLLFGRFPSSGVFKFSDGRITSLVHPGDPAPGGETFDYADSASLNDAGQVAFYAFTETRDGVYLLSEGTPSAVALDGDPAPGGGTFVDADVPKLNAQTQVGFLGLRPQGNGVFLATPTR